MNFKFYLILTSLLAFLSACSHYETNAPVFSNNSNGGNDQEKPVQPLTPDHPEAPKATTHEEVKPSAPAQHYNYHVVKPGETLYSIGVSSGLGFERLADLNNLAKPYNIRLGQKIKIINEEAESTLKKVADKPPKEKVSTVLKKPKKSSENKAKTQEIKETEKEPEVKKNAQKIVKAEQKSSIISIDNEKMLKLNFQWPVRGKVVKNFPQTNNKGIDIAGDVGRLVTASSAGKVAYSGQGLIGFGKVLIIKHNDRFLSAYANIEQIAVNEGQQIGQGQHIAKIGSNGSKKSTLHFEIRKNGKPVNPLKYLP
jgi:lipoprotein NlpD